MEERVRAVEEEGRREREAMRRAHDKQVRLNNVSFEIVPSWLPGADIT
jgi:hypothetical protein